MKWVVVTGGGSGIGRAMVQHFSRHCKVLTCGRRLCALEETKRNAIVPDHVYIVEADIADGEQRKLFAQNLPSTAELQLLVQNAAIGDPAGLQAVDTDHLELAFKVNVIAPMSLTQLFLPALKRCGSSQSRNHTRVGVTTLIDAVSNAENGCGRILHLGTSVAHRAQAGTLTYGVTKMAFHRLYQQINAETSLDGVVCGSLSPGIVDTEGVRDHVEKARSCALPHVKYFEEVFEKNSTTPMNELMLFVEELLAMDEATFASREWRFSEWSAQRAETAAQQ
jgi:NAD(P)-dependent dehydrogenase (short-subunit alcohol dehydrogenase family)